LEKRFVRAGCTGRVSCKSDRRRSSVYDGVPFLEGLVTRFSFQPTNLYGIMYITALHIERYGS